MKKLRYLIIHCTATPEGRDVRPEDVKRWHTAPRPLGFGWSRPGYSDFIDIKGELHNLRAYDGDFDVSKAERTWGVKGLNDVSRHICYAGGLCAEHWTPSDTRNELQKLALRNYIFQTINLWPDILIAGHNQFSSKSCPSFSVPAWLMEIGAPEKNICL